MSKDFVYASHASTRITMEIADADHPNLAVQQRIHGYDLIELMQHRSASDVQFLLYTGELPSTAQA